MPYANIADRDAAVRRYYTANRERRVADMKAYNASPAGKAAQKRRREKASKHHAERLAPYLERGCVDCGGHEDLHFHHLDPSTKRYSLTVMTTNGDKSVADELAKCVVVCRAHHIARHRQMGSKRLAERTLNPVDDVAEETA